MAFISIIKTAVNILLSVLCKPFTYVTSYVKSLFQSNEMERPVSPALDDDTFVYQFFSDLFQNFEESSPPIRHSYTTYSVGMFIDVITFCTMFLTLIHIADLLYIHNSLLKRFQDCLMEN